MFAATGVLGLFIRMLTSLALVLAIIAVAYAVMRRRSAGNGDRALARTPARHARRPGSHGSHGGSVPGRRPRRSSRSQVEVVGRVGLTRSTAAVAVRFGDRIVLVGAAEQSQPTVLAEVDVATWELYDRDATWSVPSEPADEVTNGAALPVRRPTGFIDALREATVRRA